MGNNGRLDLPIDGTLAITKNISAAEGFTLPENAQMTFTVTFDGTNGKTNFPAVLRDAQGYPLNHETHTRVTGNNANSDAQFTIASGDTFTLRDGETLKITGLPDGATYTVVETGQAGYQGKVTINGDTTTVAAGTKGDNLSTASVTGEHSVPMATEQKVVIASGMLV